MNEPVVSAWQYPHGVFAIDSGLLRPRMAACYLVADQAELAIIECGTNFSVPRILRFIRMHGWKADQVRWVIVTHVHLDHAGGAGALVRDLPRARLVVHPRGARHMIDPARLEASARSVYGDEAFELNYGSLVAVAEDRVEIAGEGDSLPLGNRTLDFIDSPGHARHHFCVWDERSRGWFTGDTFGIAYKELDTGRGHYIFPTTSPVQFDPVAHHESIDRVASRNPEYLYPTHFGRIRYDASLASRMHEGVDAYVQMAERAVQHDSPESWLESEMYRWLAAGARSHGCLQSDAELARILEMDVKLNTAGLLHWMANRDA